MRFVEYVGTHIVHQDVGGGGGGVVASSMNDHWDPGRDPAHKPLKI